MLRLTSERHAAMRGGRAHVEIDREIDITGL